MVTEAPLLRAIDSTRQRIATEWDCVARWQRSDSDAQALDLQVARINELFHLITGIDSEVQAGVIEGEPFDPELERRVEELFAEWATRFEPVLELVNSGRWPAVSGAEEFHRNFREVERVLTPDDQFLSGDKLSTGRSLRGRSPKS